MTAWILSLIGLVIYAHLAEYAAHRWMMHRPIFPRSWFYREHAIEHHGRRRNDINIEISPLTVALLAAPALSACAWLGPWWLAAWVVGVHAYACAWTQIHKAHHDLGAAWVKRLPGYAYSRRAHLRHHDQPHRNFGTVFPWTDYLFRTAAH